MTKRKPARKAEVRKAWGGYVDGCLDVTTEKYTERKIYAVYLKRKDCNYEDKRPVTITERRKPK